tara:strand:- start:123 stop:674 length:552 start_codon:yes stop_codon:yes gene_type:complete
MTFKSLSRDELTNYLTDGIPLPKSALTDENVIDFYFEELLQFINIAENEYWARSTDYLELTITIDDNDFLILRFVGGKVVVFLIDSRPNIIDTMTPEEASDIVGIVYGIVVYNEKWVQVNELVEEFVEEFSNKAEYDATKAKINVDPKFLDKLNKSPLQYPDKIMKMKDYDKYFKKDKDKKYG